MYIQATAPISRKAVLEGAGGPRQGYDCRPSQLKIEISLTITLSSQHTAICQKSRGGRSKCQNRRWDGETGVIEGRGKSLYRSVEARGKTPIPRKTGGRGYGRRIFKGAGGVALNSLRRSIEATGGLRLICHGAAAIILSDSERGCKRAGEHLIWAFPK